MRIRASVVTALLGTLGSLIAPAALDAAGVDGPDFLALPSAHAQSEAQKAQARERFHPDDRLMLWFDFFEHDPATVIGDMEAFMTHCAPHLRGDT